MDKTGKKHVGRNRLNCDVHKSTQFLCQIGKGKSFRNVVMKNLRKAYISGCII